MPRKRAVSVPRNGDKTVLAVMEILSTDRIVYCYKNARVECWRRAEPGGDRLECRGYGRGATEARANLVLLSRDTLKALEEHADVACYRLTERGRLVVECLRKAYEALGLKPLPGGD